MKKLLVFFSAIFICTICFARTINWLAGNQVVQTTSCEYGDSITPPIAPAKRGYTFKNWIVSPNLFDITALAGVSNITIIDANHFSFHGYPTMTVSLKQLAPTLQEGDVITITGTLEGSSSRFIYLGGFGVWVFDQSNALTQNMLNGTVGFYCSTADEGKTCILDFQIEKQ